MRQLGLLALCLGFSLEGSAFAHARTRPGYFQPASREHSYLREKQGEYTLASYCRRDDGYRGPIFDLNVTAAVLGRGYFEPLYFTLVDLRNGRRTRINIEKLESTGQALRCTERGTRYSYVGDVSFTATTYRSNHIGLRRIHGEIVQPDCETEGDSTLTFFLNSAAYVCSRVDSDNGLALFAEE